MSELQSAPRRRYPRKAFKKPVAYVCKGVSEVTQGIEIGEGGVSFVSELILAMDDQVVVNFFIPDGDFFSLRAVVRNHSMGENGLMTYGLSFDDVSLGLKRQIRAYVARMSMSDHMSDQMMKPN